MRRPTKRKRQALALDAPRIALGALERIRGVLERKGRPERVGPPASRQELGDRARLLRQPLPPSYEAVMRVASAIGEREELLDAEAIVKARDAIDEPRIFPFAREGDVLVCFDRRNAGKEKDAVELPIVEHANGSVRPRARSFAEWLDAIADRREDDIAAAADIPALLRALLVQLGFTFDDPIVGRLETGDSSAIEALIGPNVAREVRGTDGRLFDSSGKASLTLSLDEFSLAVALRTGIYVLQDDDVFRWLRYFRDESFFGGEHEPSHPDQARDLRRSPREPQRVLRGTMSVGVLPATRHLFRAASGTSPSDFYVLGRTHSPSEHAPSLVLHIHGGAVASAHGVNEALNDIHVDDAGTLWGLAAAGHVVRFDINGDAAVFSLERPSRGRAWWYGIGAAQGRVLVWGAGALLEWRGKRFQPFSPDAHLEPEESVVGLSTEGSKIAMLVSGRDIGGVAHFDGKKWLAVSEAQVIAEPVVDLDVRNNVAVVLTRHGDILRMDRPNKAPTPVAWNRENVAFVTEAGAPRPLHQIRGVDGGALLATDGGVIAAGSGEPLFYRAEGSDRARLVRVGEAVVVLCGPNVWTWSHGALDVLDMRAW